MVVGITLEREKMTFTKIRNKIRSTETTYLFERKLIFLYLRSRSVRKGEQRGSFGKDKSISIESLLNRRSRLIIKSILSFPKEYQGRAAPIQLVI